MDDNGKHIGLRAHERINSKSCSMLPVIGAERYANAVYT